MLGPTISLSSSFIDATGTAAFTGKTRPLANIMAKMTPIANINKEAKKKYVDFLEKKLDTIINFDKTTGRQE